MATFKKILIVEDEVKIRTALIFNLKMVPGLEATAVGSGYEAIDLIDQGQRFDLILLDLMMPSLSGIEVYEKIKVSDFSIPVVFMSANQDSDEWKKAKKTGKTLLSKPIKTNVLIHTILEITGKQNDQ